MGSSANTSLYPSTFSKLGSAIDLDSAEVRGVLGAENGGTATDALSSAYWVNRANHTGTQSVSTITGLTLESLSGQPEAAILDSLSSLTAIGYLVQNSLGQVSAVPLSSVVRQNDDVQFSNVSVTETLSQSTGYIEESTVIDNTYGVVYANAEPLSADLVINLYPASGNGGRYLTVKNVGPTGMIILSAVDDEVIDFSETYTLSSQGDSVILQAVEVGPLSGWNILSERIA